MGGRLDATNVFPKPLICLFTPISYDHLIAKEKAGILKPGAHAVVGKQIYEEANNSGAPLEFSQIVDEVEVADTREGMTVKLTFKGESHVVTSHLEGDFQRVNIGIVCRAFEVLDRIKPAEYPCTASMVEAGLKGVNWPGRMQKLAIADSNVSFILDGAHNDHGINCLSSYVDANLRKNGKTLTWVTGFKAGKDCKPLLEKLLRRARGMPWISCLPPLQVRESAVSLFSDIDATHFDTIDQALSYLREKKVSGTIFVCGSLYLVRDTLRSTLASTKRTLPN
ncbi:Mur ligase [Chytridium lagenaria]|nr:Mur ligase [Chytridium lagenaria]